jgi:hypothetical protein
MLKSKKMIGFVAASIVIVGLISAYVIQLLLTTPPNNCVSDASYTPTYPVLVDSTPVGSEPIDSFVTDGVVDRYEFDGEREKFIEFYGDNVGLICTEIPESNAIHCNEGTVNPVGEYRAVLLPTDPNEQTIANYYVEVFWDNCDTPRTQP